MRNVPVGCRSSRNDRIGRHLMDVATFSLDKRPRQCTATSKHTGERCKRIPIPGGNVCTIHGGKSPLAIAAANQALLAARVPAAELLFEVIEWWRRTTCETCGLPKGDPSPAIRAAIAVLDRTGLGPTANLTVETKKPMPWAAWMKAEHLEQMSIWIEDAKGRMRRGEPQAEIIVPRLAVVDGEVVDEGVLIDDGPESQETNPAGDQNPEEQDAELSDGDSRTS